MAKNVRKNFSRLVYRVAVGILFFLMGLCFSSWASRIPTIRQKLHLTDTQLGMVLFALPTGSLLAMPLSGWLIHKKGSRKVVITALIIYGVVLVRIAATQSIFQLIFCLVIFGLLGNMSNIAVNTQAIGVESMYKRSIMASFHGLWSLAGFTGAAIGTFMIGNNIEPLRHFLAIMVFVLLAIVFSFPYTLKEDVNHSPDQPVFVWPEKSLIQLGVLTLCSMICEGAMFDWSGIYFQKVIQAKPSLIGAGYTAFMSTMATGRFIADKFSNKFGLRLTLQASGLLTAAGLLISVIFPYVTTAIIGFLLVGFGVSSVVPLVYGVAGKSKVMSAGVALAAVTTIGFFGLLIGPVLIGLVSGATSLRISFLLIACMGICVSLLASRKSLELNDRG